MEAVRQMKRESAKREMAGEIIGDILRLTVLAGLGAAGILAILIWKKNIDTRVKFIRFVIQDIDFEDILYIL